MKNKENNNKNNLKDIEKDKDDNIILEKNKEESDKENSEDSVDSAEDEKLEKERENLLNNPESFKRKRDFFSFYSKNRQSAIISQKNEVNRRVVRLKSQIFEPKRDIKKFSKFELKPRGFGINKIKEKISIFEKKDLEDKYKMLNLTTYQKTFYENNEPKKFDVKKFKIEKMENIMVKADNKDKKLKKVNNLCEQHFSFEAKNMSKKNNEKKESNNKLNLNLIVDYSKILNSSKITKKQKDFDLFLTENKENQKTSKNIQNEDNSDESSDSLSIQEVSTNLSHGMDHPISRHIKQKSEICYYKDIIRKISSTESDKKVNLYNNYKEDYSTGYQNREINKNNKYILVKKNDNKIKIEKKNKFNNGIKKVLSENISDNATLRKLDNAKYKLNQSNNNKIIKKQIFDMLEKLIIENNNKSNNFIEKINNIYDRQKLIRAFEILPQLSVINQKIKTLIQNSSDKLKDKFNEKEIRNSASSIFFVESIGLESLILFNGKNKIGNRKIINDIGEDIELDGINNKKKYIKYYFQNLYKSSYFLDVLINIINQIQETVNISTDK